MPFDKSPRPEVIKPAAEIGSADRGQWVRLRVRLADQDRLFLLSPLLISLGIAAYFAGWSSLALPVLIALTILLSLKIDPQERRYAFLLLLVGWCLIATGYGAAYWSDARKAHAVLGSTIGPIELSTRVHRIEPRPEERQRLWIEILSSDSQNPPALKGASFRVNAKSDDVRDLLPGSISRFRMMLFPSSKPIVPEGYDASFWHYHQGLSGTGRVLGEPIPDQVEGKIGAENGLSFYLQGLRGRIRARILTHMDEPSAGLAVALLTGIRGGIDRESAIALRGAGLAHILAISGLHMALVAGGVFFAIRYALALFGEEGSFFPQKSIAAIVAMAAAIGYYSISGGAISAQRAFMMIMILFVAVLLNRPALTLRNVAIVAVLILLFSPEALFSAGFQMSFAATTALIFGYEKITRHDRSRLMMRMSGLPNLVRIPVIMLGGIAVTSLIAGAATAPYAAYHFNVATPYGLAGNLLAMPLVSFIVMPAGVIGLLVMPLGLEALPFWVMDSGLKLITWIAGVVTAQPNAVLGLGQRPIEWLIALTLTLYLAVVLRRPPMMLLFGLFLAAIWFVPQRFPVVLVSGSGATVAVHDKEGGEIIALSSRAHRITLERWARSAGFPDYELNEERVPRSQCDQSGCAYHLKNGIMLSYSTAARDFADSCQVSDIIIARHPVSRRMEKECGAETQIINVSSPRPTARAYTWQGKDSPRSQPRVELISTSSLRRKSTIMGFEKP